MAFLGPSCSRDDSARKLPSDSEILQQIAGTWNSPSRGTGDPVKEGTLVYSPSGAYTSRVKWVNGNTTRVDVIEGTYEIKNGFLLETITNMTWMKPADSPPAAIFEQKVLQIDAHQLVISNDSGIHSFDRKR